MAESRRRFLAVGLGGAALLAVGGASIALRRTRGRTPRLPLRFFTPEEYAVVAAVADRVLATALPEGADGGDAGGAPPDLGPLKLERPPAPAAAEVDVAGRVDAFLAPLDPHDAKDLKQLVALFENGLFGLLSGTGPTPFTAKSPGEQDAHLAAWAHSRLAVKRSGYQVLKRLCCALYFSAPATYASVGYPGPPVEFVRETLQLRRSLSEPPPEEAPR